mgnify:CR=1 FL=1
MAEVILKNIKKIYPHQEPKKKKKGEPEKKTNLQITEEGVLAVDNFNLHIQDKEFIVLVGPSGCGKSTTLRMVAGLEEISGGELYIGGQLMNDVAPKDRDISMVFQNYALYPHMTVYDNMAFGLKLRKTPKTGSVITTMPKGSKVEVLEKGSEWSKVKYNGKTWRSAYFTHSGGVTTEYFTDVDGGSVYVRIDNVEEHKDAVETMMKSLEFADDITKAKTEAMDVKLDDIEIKR